MQLPLKFKKLLNKLFAPTPINKKKQSINSGKQEVAKYAEFLKDFGNNFEQKRAVVSNSKRILVLAGAGSGKTKVLTKRAIHLVKNKNVPLHNILALTFTNEARMEMVKRISQELSLKESLVEEQVRTFHSFGFKLLKQNEQFKLIRDDEQRTYILDILNSFQEDNDIMDSVYKYVQNELIEKVIDKEKTDREPRYKGKPTHFSNRQIKTNSGIYVRSKAERDVANLLSSMGVEWEYERIASWADGQFKPDFSIGNEVFIEIWCYNKDTPEFPLINKKTYLEHRKWKEDQYQKHNKTIISIEEKETHDLVSLQIRLHKELETALEKQIQTSKLLELLNLDKTAYKEAFDHFVDELVEIINLANAELLNSADIKKRLENQEKEKVIYFYNVLIPVLEKYRQLLRTKDLGKKDFNDLINDAIALLLNSEQHRKYYQSKIKYLLIDEFQDVSRGEVELLKLLINRDASLFVVGDDWQSIYGWRGSRVEFILEFEKDFGPCERIILPINYRSSKNIVEASNYFIQLSDKQIKKNISCCEERKFDNSKIIQVNAYDDFDGATFVIKKAEELMQMDKSLQPSNFLVLYRSKRTMKGYKAKFKENNFKIKYSTIHSSKGKEAEYVFVLGLKGGTYGFPNVYADKDIKRVILDIPTYEKEEEERRLFYVAMTRAKKGLYLISEKGNESSFVTELPSIHKQIIQK